MKAAHAPAHFSALARRSSEPPISWLMKLKLDRPDLVSLAAGFTDNETLPVAEVGALVRDLFRHPTTARHALQYGSTIGHPALRRELLARWARQDGFNPGASRVNADHVVVTSGSQQLLYLTTEVLCDPGDIVLVEDPTYFVYLGIIEAMGIRARGFDGVEHLKARLQTLKTHRQIQRLKLIYLVTYFRNPTGYTWSLDEKVEALRIIRHYEKAAGHPLYILDDAAYRDLRFEGADVPSFKALDPANQRVVYTSTLTKPFATGIKLGYGILPSPIQQAVLRAKGNHDFGSANFLQTLLAEALRQGLYSRHLTTIASAYRKKRDVMMQALHDAHAPFPLKFNTPQGGLYIWLELPQKARTSARSSLFKRVLDAGVLYVPGDLCYCADPDRPIPTNFIRLSFGAPTSAQIRRGIRDMVAHFR
jgi:2-aminoadipate transaminase